MFEDANGIQAVVEIQPTKREKISPFDFAKSITETKEDIYDGNESSYNQYLINKAISFNPDCVFYVHSIAYDGIPDKAHYYYLLNIISKKKRYGGWTKKDQLPEIVDLVKEAYGYSTKDALIALELLSDKQLLELKHAMRKGGKL